MSARLPVQRARVEADRAEGPLRTSAKPEGTSEERQDRPNYHVAALTRGLRVLRVLAEAGSPLPLTALEERAAIPKSTLVRLLSVLAEADYVVRVDETPSFWLGPSVMPLADSYSSALDVSAYAEEVLKQLAASSGQTANVAILDGHDVVHLCVVEPDRPIRFRSSTGSRDGAYRTGLGKALLAFAAPDRLSDHLPPEPFPALTKRTITTRRAMFIELEQVRRAGYAFDNEEGDVGVCCLAVPIRQGSEVVAAVSVAAPPASSVSPPGTNCYRPSGKQPSPWRDRTSFTMHFRWCVVLSVSLPSRRVRPNSQPYLRNTRLPIRASWKIPVALVFTDVSLPAEPRPTGQLSSRTNVGTSGRQPAPRPRRGCSKSGLIYSWSSARDR